MEGTTLPEISTQRGIDKDDEETLIRFVECALDAVRDHLEQNREEAKSFTDVQDSVDDVLDNSNIREVDVRANRFENPRVTVWLKDCPIWANDAWDDTLYPNGINAYNGKVHTVLDVREF